MSNDTERIRFISLLRRTATYFLGVLIFGILLQVFGRYQDISFQNQKMLLLLLRISSLLSMFITLFAAVFTIIYRKLMDNTLHIILLQYGMYFIFSILSASSIIIWDVFMLPDR